ncbi:MAG: sugar phosphate isomerase/epimerase [Streptomycetaceae bacterium]|nr:sugar phosphate isomerase/epimerase [Streptomycetaceae bacterium]
MTGTLGVQLYSVHEQLTADRRGTLRRLAALGYHHVEPFALGYWTTPADELLSTARALRTDLDAADLGVTSLHTAVPSGSLSAVAEACRILGTDTAVVAVPLLVEGFDGMGFADRAEVTAFARRLNEAARDLARHGVRLGYHNHTAEWQRLPDGSVPFDILWDLLDTDVVAEVDVYWAAVAGQDPAEVLARLGDRAFAVHLKDGPGTEDASQTRLGTGIVDTAAALGAAPGLQWHIAEIDTTDEDRFGLLAANRGFLLGAQLTTP